MGKFVPPTIQTSVKFRDFELICLREFQQIPFKLGNFTNLKALFLIFPNLSKSKDIVFFDYLYNFFLFLDFLPRIHYNLRGVEQIFWFLLSIVFG